MLWLSNAETFRMSPHSSEGWTGHIRYHMKVQDQAARTSDKSRPAQPRAISLQTATSEIAKHKSVICRIKEKSTKYLLVFVQQILLDTMTLNKEFASLNYLNLYAAGVTRASCSIMEPRS